MNSHLLKMFVVGVFAYSLPWILSRSRSRLASWKGGWTPERERGIWKPSTNCDGTGRRPRVWRQPGTCKKREVFQVWSLTQFCSVDFSKSKVDVKKCVFNKRTIKVCVSYCWRCPETSAPITAHLTMSLYLCSSGSNPWDGDERVAGTTENSVSLIRGH